MLLTLLGTVVLTLIHINQNLKDMKRIIVTAVAILLLAAGYETQAQVSVSVNISSQPLWGPIGYSHVEYYYLPQYEVYYSVPKAQFVYLDGGNWIFASALPARFGTINYYNTYKVVINQPTPYLYYKTHKVKYAKYKGSSYKQVVIRDSKEPKYYVVKGHPNYGTPPGQAKKAAPVKTSYSNSKPVAKPAKPAPAPQTRSSHSSNSGKSHGNSGGHGGGNKGGGGGKGKK